MSYKGTKWSVEQKERWAKKCLETKINNINKPIMTVDERKSFGLKSSIRNKQYWTEEKRKEHSLRMKEIVLKNSSSYTKNSVSGRVKLYEVNSSSGLTKVKGTWELKVATWLNNNNVKWTNEIKKPFEYFWNDRIHFYYPDFFLVDYNLFIEVKGYETERDRLKWLSCENLIILKKEEISDLDRFLKTYCGIEQ